MRKRLYDRPWIWIVLFLGTLIAGSVATVIIAEVNKPEIVKPKTPRKSRAQSTSTQTAVLPWLNDGAGLGVIESARPGAAVDRGPAI